MGRKIEGGINWIWYYTDTREDAEEWFKELTGAEPQEPCTIINPVVRKPAGKYDNKYGFRLHR